MNHDNPVTSSERAGMVAAIIVVAVVVLVMWLRQVWLPAADPPVGDNTGTVTEVSVMEAAADTVSVTPAKRKKRSRKASAPSRPRAPERNPLDEPVARF